MKKPEGIKMFFVSKYRRYYKYNYRYFKYKYKNFNLQS